MNEKRQTMILAAFTICLMLLSSSSRAAEQNSQVPFPIIPVLAQYEYVPQHFLQWINDHPQYSMIEASVSKSDPPVVQMVLTEKETRRRIYYCDSEARVKALTSAGQAARFAKIDFRAVTNVAEMPTYGFGFSDERGQALRWRFILASEPTERGAGLTPISGAPGLRLLYRNLGTAAGAGTAAQIGDKVIEADPWPEISAPPYFVAHRGTYVEGMDVGMLVPGTDNWQVVRAPSELKEGAEWTLSDDKKRTRQFRVTARRGDELTIEEIGKKEPGSAKLSLTARAMPKGFAVRSILLTHGPGLMRLSFKPDLDLTGSSGAEVAFQIDLGRHEKIVQGTISAERRSETIHLRWQPKSPDWAKSQVLNTSVTAQVAGYKIEAR
jgi:hypothetical protein